MIPPLRFARRIVLAIFGFQLDQEDPSFVKEVQTDRGPGCEVNGDHGDGVQQVFQQVLIANRPTVRFPSAELHQNSNGIHKSFVKPSKSINSACSQLVIPVQFQIDRTVENYKA